MIFNISEHVDYSKLNPFSFGFFDISISHIEVQRNKGSLLSISLLIFCVMASLILKKLR